jgi:MYXO-CTERM domain-containing protein
MKSLPSRVVALLVVGSASGLACGDPGTHQPEAVGVSSSADTTECNAGPYVDGVDVYDGTGTIDWSAAKAAGIGFAIIKATQGNYNTQSTFATNWSGAKAAGVARSAYHFFDPTVDGVAQANYFLGVMGTLEKGDMPPTLDIECPDGDPNCLGGASGDETGSVITSRMNDWISTVKAATGVAPLIYTFGSYFTGAGVDTTGLEANPLYIADPQTSDCINVPSPWTQATIWQNSWTATVAGIPSPGNTDADKFLGSMADFQSLLIGGSAATPPFVAPSQANGNDAITVINWPDGHVELFAETAGQTSIHTYTTGSGDSWTPASALEGTSACALASVMWAPKSGKYAQVFDALPSGKTEDLTGSAVVWTPFVALGGTGLSHLSTLAFADGRVEVFALGSDQTVWHDAWLLAKKAWGGWESLGGASIATGVGAILGSDGHAEIFATDASGVAWRNATPDATSTTWSGWVAMTGGKLATRPIPVRWADGHLEVFARGTDDNLYTSEASTSGTWPAFMAINAGTPIEGEPSALVYEAYGPEIFARNPKGELVHAWYETNAFVPWANDFHETLASDPLAWIRPDGQGEVFGIDDEGNLVKSIHDSADWSSWTTLATGMDACTSIPKPDSDAGGGTLDGGPSNDSGHPSGKSDAGGPGATGGPANGGCGCRMASQPGRGWAWASLSLVLAGLVRRRRSRAERPRS